MHGCMDAWMHGCMDACMHGCMDACMHACMYVSACVCACVPVCMCVCMCIVLRRVKTWSRISRIIQNLWFWFWPQIVSFHFLMPLWRELGWPNFGKVGMIPTQDCMNEHTGNSNCSVCTHMFVTCDLRQEFEAELEYIRTYWIGAFRTFSGIGLKNRLTASDCQLHFFGKVGLKTSSLKTQQLSSLLHVQFRPFLKRVKTSRASPGNGRKFARKGTIRRVVCWRIRSNPVQFHQDGKWGRFFKQTVFTLESPSHVTFCQPLDLVTLRWVNTCLGSKTWRRHSKPHKNMTFPLKPNGWHNRMYNIVKWDVYEYIIIYLS